MQQALGWLRWTPDQFWDATLSELFAAVAGLLEWERNVEPATERGVMFDRLLEMAEAERRRESEERKARAQA